MIFDNDALAEDWKFQSFGFQNLTTDLKVEKELSSLRSHVSRNNGRRA